MLRLVFTFNWAHRPFSQTPSAQTLPDFISLSLYLLAPLQLWKALPIARYACYYRPTSVSRCNLEQPDILIDGYIANTLLPQGTELYLCHFINCLEQESGATIVPYTSGWIVQRPSALPTTTGAHPPTSEPADEKKLTVQQRRELFDCQVNLDTGTIVPQPTQIKPCKRTGLLSPVFFIMRNGFLGVPYKNLPASKYLYNATAHVPPLLKRPNLNARIRIMVRLLSLLMWYRNEMCLQWPGYKTFHYEFRIFDRKLGKDVPITVSRLVERVARGLHRLYLVRVTRPGILPWTRSNEQPNGRTLFFS